VTFILERGGESPPGGQEALTNAIRHAQANEIRIELIYDDTQFSLRVKDDGQGFGVGSIPQSGGLACWA